jgi:hypothetical protein
MSKNVKTTRSWPEEGPNPNETFFNVGIYGSGNYLEGGRTYKVTLPGPIPAKNFWSFTAYDNETRSLLATDQKLAGLDSTVPGIEMNPDGGVTVWIGPAAPAGHEKNWVQTMPGKGYTLGLRLYGPLEPWLKQSWRPGDLELLH